MTFNHHEARGGHKSRAVVSSGPSAAHGCMRRHRGRQPTEAQMRPFRPVVDRGHAGQPAIPLVSVRIDTCICSVCPFFRRVKMFSYPK